MAVSRGWSHPGVLLAVLLFGALLFTATGVWAQLQEGGNPRIDRIAFRGNDAMPDRDLRPAIVTQETRCRALLLQPLCWLTDWSLVVDHHHLLEEELERDVVRLEVFYFRHGYRQAAVDAQIARRSNGVEIVFEIEEGEPTIIDRREIRQTSPALTERQIRRARIPGDGDVLNLVSLELGMANLQERLGRSGYLDAAIHDTIHVDDSSRRAVVGILVETGRVATLRELDISGNRRVDDVTISDGLRMRPGRLLRTSDIVAARRSLYESNLFHEVRVTVPEQPDSAKRVEVTVREAPQQAFRVGGGFNTIEFVQLEGRYTHFNWLGRGRRLNVRGTLGNLLAGQLNDRIIFHDVVPADELQDRDPFVRPTWEVTLGFLQPAFRSAENVLALDLFANRRTIPGVVIDRGYGGEATVSRRVDHQTQLSLSYAFERTSVDAGDLYFCVNYGVCDRSTILAIRGRNTMSPLAVGLVADRADNPLGPTTGYRLRIGAEHASAFTLSEFRYNRISGEAAYYYPFDLRRRRVAAGRIRMGWVRHLPGTSEAVGIRLDDGGTALLHPRKRFYAGGSRSVRGYGENQLGPQILTIDPEALMEPENGCTSQEIASATCDPGVAPMSDFLIRPLGGTALLEMNVEYRFPFVAGLTGAVFVDAAAIGVGIEEAFTLGNMVVSPGLGLRLATPVGPVRLDLGIRPGITERLPVVTEFVDDEGERRLVELATPRRYNPIEAAGGGFLREIFSRLALHLSIGEAY